MRILIIDDDKVLNKSLKNMLEAECFEVDTATDGEKGVYYACTNEYDLIILDKNLPEKDGLLVLKEIREDGQNMPILMLSVVSESATKVDFLNTGADDYLTKPFSFAELLARIRALLRRPKEAKGDILKIDNLVLDTKKQIFKRGDKKIYLTLKEYELLEYLMRNKGNVVTRGMIMEHVWDMNADLFSNAIEVHVSNLRRKIHLKNQVKLLYTIPGRGYKLDLAK
ncbi:MAG: response regulator transcription factor [Patescibacteria group bacterium]|nr:response regulator transcription factor [Patescibacteria group bacterium]